MVVVCYIITVSATISTVSSVKIFRVTRGDERHSSNTLATLLHGTPPPTILVYSVVINCSLYSVVVSLTFNIVLYTIVSRLV